MISWLTDVFDKMLNESVVAYFRNCYGHLKDKSTTTTRGQSTDFLSLNANPDFPDTSDNQPSVANGS